VHLIPITIQRPLIPLLFSCLCSSTCWSSLQSGSHNSQHQAAKEKPPSLTPPEFTIHYEFIVHSVELSVNSTDFRVFKKFMFLSLVKCILTEFSQILLIFSEFYKIRRICLPLIFLFPPNYQTLGMVPPW
jgi:hypothetical protein